MSKTKSHSKSKAKSQGILRIVTASALFDGHDAAINMFRRLFQTSGLEVIHIGHNRSVQELVTTAIQEDADAICVSSYQGGHMEYFTYLRQLLNESGGEQIGIFGGGGGTILPSEIAQLQSMGITRLYHPEDSRKMGLRGVVRDAIAHMHKCFLSHAYYRQLIDKLRGEAILSHSEIAKAITFCEEESLCPELRADFFHALQSSMLEPLLRVSQNPSASQFKCPSNTPLAPHRPAIVGFTGPGGAGKSSLIDELILRYLSAFPQGRVGVLAFDPTKKTTGGALLGDRIRMNAVYDPRVFLRSMATRDSGSECSAAGEQAVQVMQKGGFDLLILETTGIGQGDSKIVPLCDLSIYVMTSEYGASLQLEKIDMLDLADIVVLNKFDKLGSHEALEDVRHAYAQAHNLHFDAANRAVLPVFGSIASDFNDPGVTCFFNYLVHLLNKKGLALLLAKFAFNDQAGQLLCPAQNFSIIPQERTFYLGEIAQTVRAYKRQTALQSAQASAAYRHNAAEDELSEDNLKSMRQFQALMLALKQPELSYTVRHKTIQLPLFTQSLADLSIPKIALPALREWGDIVVFMRQENFPGHFPYTAGVFTLKSQEEEPKRQFAGEGSPEKTNSRFHYLCRNDKAKRLSTAFDSVTLYGEDPDSRPDTYGKIGNSGVSIATLEDVKALYAGFNLIDPLTSVSLTINGPAPMILAMFFNTAIDFEIQQTTGKLREELDPEEFEKIKSRVLSAVRGTVQADILKEEQAQNECIFSSKFALKMMGDIEEYFIRQHVKNFYSVSISGYHIAEAGANPITQLAFTLANGFTLIEYYLARGMAIDDFAPHLSFFFSSGLDPEYAVIGRVARRIWAIALQNKYQGNARSCKLKYHIQTSGRSLHAQEMAFNDVRTTLQAFLAVNDNCSSLHTNAYDEAITTPTEESVRRAMAIQLILMREFGLAKCENALQGSYFIEALTEIVEEAVLDEFEALSKRGGVLGAMEKQYQRHRIQSESMKYELMKSSGELPIIGVNTFTSEDGQTDYEHIQVVRATEAEKLQQIERTKAFIAKAGPKNQAALESLRQVALGGGNIFEELMETVRYCSLGQISHLLYACGGQYRRSM